MQCRGWEVLNMRPVAPRAVRPSLRLQAASSLYLRTSRCYAQTFSLLRSLRPSLLAAAEQAEYNTSIDVLYSHQRVFTSVHLVFMSCACCTHSQVSHHTYSPYTTNSHIRTQTSTSHSCISENPKTHRHLQQTLDDVEWRNVDNKPSIQNSHPNG